MSDKGTKSPEWGLVTYGLATQDADEIMSRLADLVADLKVCVHFCPNAEKSSPGFLIKDSASRYLPPMFIRWFPIPPPFPFSAGAPVQVSVSKPRIVDAYYRSANNLSLTRTLEALKRHLGPHFNFEKLWAMHTYYEFAERDASSRL
ncbi:hypothetical protein JVU11DRAFT_5084 [Chiua virens]|nr:hypothetical protein JVU11DRAFT_5084 [Chiua virens]